MTDGPERSLVRGRLLIVAAALLWSLSGLLLKSPPLERLPVAARGPLLACYRALFAGVFLLTMVRWKRARFRGALVPSVIAFTVMNVLFVCAMVRTTAAAAIFLQYTATPWAFVLGVLLLGERVERRNLFAVLTAVCGIAWIVRGDWGSENLTGNLIALGSGFSLACVLLSLRYLRDEDSGWIVSLNHLGAGLLLLPWVLTIDVRLDASQWALTAVLGVVQMGTPYFLFALGSRTVPTQEAALLLLLEPVLNPVWVWLFWGEAVSPAIWAGGAFILGGLAARYGVPLFRRTGL